MRFFPRPDYSTHHRSAISISLSPKQQPVPSAKWPPRTSNQSPLGLGSYPDGQSPLPKRLYTIRVRDQRSSSPFDTHTHTLVNEAG
ncbi:hypothetical protein M441DRAFT_56071 [Trichoderma asperellum CBS 433.97]|uniref:Uncharacterized protein n=1 Tax=Trichoderma asperellum (strain ATCC 204424 / CBS 433.97 / NBRC 101777) TaxID=1042311 RepID=A0A2T3ZE13_TRIA4|nr:hypothetical protein M441DRAFT_56071 [Trichoderma asperellum CBS 433.97]PTB43039.1 hypothetical protein M441DRAFT_56071 [Trichoderma asperellum CBS 433.97]